MTNHTNVDLTCFHVGAKILVIFAQIYSSKLTAMICMEDFLKLLKCTVIKTVASDTLINKNKEMSRTYGTYGRRKCIQCFAGEREREDLEDLRVDGRIIL